MEGKKKGVYVLTEDTPHILERLGVPTSNPQVQHVVDKYAFTVSGIVGKTFEAQVDLHRAEDINTALSGLVQESLVADPNAHVVCLDKFLLDGFEHTHPYFTRLSITRMYDGSKGARIGQPPVGEQMLRLAELAKDRNLIMVDDGIFTGGTVKVVMEQLCSLNGHIGFVKAIGFIGTPFMANASIPNLSVEIVNQYGEEIIDWIDPRDFGIFGGKLFARSTRGGVGVGVPYVLPFERTGNPISLDTSTQIGQEQYRQLSYRMLGAQAVLLRDIESITGQALTVRDLMRAGFAIPFKPGETFNPWIRDKTLVDLVSQSMYRIYSNEA